MTKEEAIKVIKDNWPEGRVLLKLALEFLIPELKESEDERIRKSIIDLVEKQMPKSENKKWMISWLEKQSEKVNAIENFNTEFERQISHLIASIINKEHEYNEGFVKWTANALLNYAKHELEKQGEHKCDCKYVGCHVNNMKRWCHKKQSEILYEKCNIKCSEYLKQGEQKPNDKVEPKFKVGDWIINSIGTLRHIVAVDKTGYETDKGWLTHEYYEQCYHLWTIKDAKDGDVLTTKNFIFIFKNIDSDNGVRYYCQYEISNYEADDLFEVAFPQCVMGRVGNGLSYYSPATEEQCDLLFSKMKEAGYEWDSEKKELKKIEQKPAFCHHEVDLSGCSEEYRKAYYDGWNNCNQQHSQLKAEQKPAWSEKNEEYLQNMIEWIDCLIDDEDCGDMTYKAHKEFYMKRINWLKSLKERYTWKPSNEQMKQLGWVAVQNKDNMIGKELMPLYQDLKKLKGE